MIRTEFKIALLSATALAASSCGSLFNGPEQAMTIAETHPISVDSQIVALTVNVDPGTSDISDMDKARLRAFADSYLNYGHGPLTVTAPSGTPTDHEGQEAAADIRQALHDAGISWAAISGATYRTGGSESGDQLVLSFTRYVATPSQCGVWSNTRLRDFRNLRTPNMGCATMNNIAAMIADPHDLVEPAAATSRDATATVRAVDLYRQGQVTASQVDGNIDTEVSE